MSKNRYVFSGSKLQSFLSDAYASGITEEEAKEFLFQKNAKRIERQGMDLSTLIHTYTRESIERINNSIRSLSLLYSNDFEERKRILEQLYQEYTRNEEEEEAEPENELLGKIAESHPKLYKYLSEKGKDHEERIIWDEDLKDLAFIFSKLPRRKKFYEYYSQFFVDQDGLSVNYQNFKSVVSRINNPDEPTEAAPHIILLF